MKSLPEISVVIPTLDRPKDLAELLLTILNQSHPPHEVIIVDDSQTDSSVEIIESFAPRFKSIRCSLKCVKGNGDGLTSARNLGVKYSNGDVVLFLDDDTLLKNDLLHSLSSFLMDHPNSMGVQPQVYGLSVRAANDTKRKIENATYKTLMLSYNKQNRLAVRRSGASVFPYSYPLTEEIEAQRLDGCCMCYQRQLFDELSFDTNLKRWGSMEDLDFSYRLYKKHPGTLHAIPSATITHKKSTESRPPSKTAIYITTTYWFYVFFKDMFEGSILNLIAFLWALIGNSIAVAGGLMFKRKPKDQWWKLVHLTNSYLYALRHLRDIKRRNLDFFNKQLKG